MAQVVILDAEPLSALAHAHDRSVLAVRSRAVLQLAREEDALLRIPAPVLAEVCRGDDRDGALLKLLATGAMGVIDLNSSIAQHAGLLLRAARMSSKHAVDAFVVATAAAFRDPVIITHDPHDLARLAARERHVRLVII